VRRLRVIAVVETKSMLLRQEVCDGRLARPTSTADPANVSKPLRRYVKFTRGRVILCAAPSLSQRELNLQRSVQAYQMWSSFGSTNPLIMSSDTDVAEKRGDDLGEPPIGV